MEPGPEELTASDLEWWFGWDQRMDEILKTWDVEEQDK